jgi:hypothetical protein
MAESICPTWGKALRTTRAEDRSYSVGTDRPPRTMRPSSRAIGAVLEWIDEAHEDQRSWARNSLVVVAVLMGALLVALKSGLVGP